MRGVCKQGRWLVDLWEKCLLGTPQVMLAHSSFNSSAQVCKRGLFFNGNFMIKMYESIFGDPYFPLVKSD